MTMSVTEDIHSITDLKRKTGKILKHLHQTGRPVILTINGKADAVLLDAQVSPLRISSHLVPMDVAASTGIPCYRQPAENSAGNCRAKFLQ